MEKIKFAGILPLIFLFVCSSLALEAAGDIPAVTIPVNGTYTTDGMIYTSVTFNVPYPVKAAISAQVQGMPAGSTIEVMLLALNNGCPERHLKVGRHCYPQDYIPCFSGYNISAQLLKDNGQAWKVSAFIYGGSQGRYALSGQIRITFTRLYEIPPLSLIKVTGPRAGAVFVKDQNIPIAWVSMGEVGTSVKIRLVPQAEPAAAFFIVASTSNDGSHSWTPSTGFPEKVWIEVSSLDGKVVGKSGLFTINP